MSLALVGDRKGIHAQNSAPITPRGMSFHFTPLSLTVSLLLLLVKDSEWDGVKQDVWKRRVSGETS